MTIWMITGKLSTGKDACLFNITLSENHLPDYAAALEKASPGAKWRKVKDCVIVGHHLDAWLEGNPRGSAIRLFADRWESLDYGLVDNPIPAD